MRLPLNQRVLITTIEKRQKRIEKKEREYQQLVLDAEAKKIEQQQLAIALKNEIPAYEKNGIYSLVMLNQQKRKKAIILSSLNGCVAQIKEIEYKITQLESGSLLLKKERLLAIKKQIKMKLYFEREELKKELYIERLEQNDIQEMALYGLYNIK